MPEWQFPNAIATAVQRMSERRGQTKDRNESPDPSFAIPQLGPTVGFNTLCPKQDKIPPWHSGDGIWCSRCGAAIEGR